MDLNALHLFVATVKSGSISKTSEQLNIPLATISRQLAKLERQLNVQLFNRFKSGVKPTEAGQRLYEQVYLSMDNLLNAKQAVLNEQQALVGKLRISTIPACQPVLDWITAFQQQHPNISVFCTFTERILDLTADGIDIAFRVGELHTENVIAKPILQSHAQLVAHPDLLAQYGTPKTPKDLINIPCAGWTKNSEDKMHWQLGKQQWHIPYLFASNDTYAISHIAQQGKAICQLPDFIAQRLIDEQGLIEVLPDYPQPNYTLNMLYAAHRYPSRIVRAFVEFVSQNNRLC